MKTDKIKKKFLESNYKNFETINTELNELFDNIQKSKKHNFKIISSAISHNVPAVYDGLGRL